MEPGLDRQIARSFTTEALAHSQAGFCRNLVKKYSIGTSLFRVLRSYSVSEIPLVFHFHSFVYQRRHIVLAFQSVIK
jgi:hypothetical protein